MPHVLIMVHDHPQRETFPQQHAFFQERILPGVVTMPGFQGGRWAYDGGPSRTHSYVSFETEAQARAMLDVVKRDASVPNPFGITMVSAVIANEITHR